MGPRPSDFDEDMVRKSPTFKKWDALGKGQKVRRTLKMFRDFPILFYN